MVFEHGWVIYRLCPCGTKTCYKHFDGTNNERPLRYWREICSFPKGHKTTGGVRQGKEIYYLKKHYGNKYKVSMENGKFKVEQICPCGKTSCEIHIFPSNVELVHSFDLCVITPKTKSNGRTKTSITQLFRKQHAMTLAEAQIFFNQFQYKWELEITTEKIVFKMMCKCGKAFENTPCDQCWMKMHRACHLCGKLSRTRMLKKCHPEKTCTKCKGICSDCKAAEISYCKYCKKDARLDHECTPLIGQHVSFRKHSIYPPLIFTDRAVGGICIDCKEPSSYNTYHRHQYRRHNDLAPSTTRSRDYKKLFCPLCSYYHYDPTNIREHMKFHSLKKTHVCKMGCGMYFTHACSEVAHRKRDHNQMTTTSSHQIRRIGRQVVRLKKN